MLRSEPVVELLERASPPAAHVRHYGIGGTALGNEPVEVLEGAFQDVDGPDIGLQKPLAECRFGYVRIHGAGACRILGALEHVFTPGHRTGDRARGDLSAVAGFRGIEAARPGGHAGSATVGSPASAIASSASSYSMSFRLPLK